MNYLVPIHFYNMFTYGASLFYANITAKRFNKTNIKKLSSECSMVMFKGYQSSPCADTLSIIIDIYSTIHAPLMMLKGNL